MAAELAGTDALDQQRLLRVLTALKNGDFTQRMPSAEGRLSGEIAQTVNSTMEFLGIFASEFQRILCEIGVDARLGGQAQIHGSGAWKDLTDSLNSTASTLTDQVRNFVQVTSAVGNGDLTTKVTVDAQGEMQELKDTINLMSARLDSFASEVTRVAREVGTEGLFGCQAEVQGVAGTWKSVTDEVNVMAANLTVQVRDMSQVVERLSTGTFGRKVTAGAQGETLELKDGINRLADQLRAR